MSHYGCKRCGLRDTCMCLPLRGEVLLPKPSEPVAPPLLPYRIEVQPTPFALETGVNAFIAQGYIPRGPPIPHGRDGWVQALILQPKPTFHFPGKTS